MSDIKVVIVEDEFKGREVLRQLVELYCPDVTIAGVADSVVSAVSTINEVRPDIILMDIELQPGTAFDIFPKLNSLDFEVIFTTAYRDYAIEAIKHSAIDYLLKPINKNDLKTAIARAIEKRGARDENSALKRFLKEFRAPATPRISLATTEGVMYVEVDQIVRCEAKGSYTSIYFKDKTKQTTSKMIKEYETSLKAHRFFRVHNSHLVNMAEVRKYVKADGGFVEMKDGSEVPVSQSHKEAFLEEMRRML